ncbi:PhoU domain-containing protein [Aquisalimonas sp.]|uniref:phosphate signaling complex PhoU family protein n=1 Tax=Aquisalimonas sp. TaxID=1872621 RepID=UPI0025BC1095|nr:PhoU domain-containing protein [Aquisalimonas sp.]
MFRQLYTALTSDNALDQAFSDLTEMLDHASWMFIRANNVLHRSAPARDVRDSIYARDRAINELERSIRRKVLRHLTVNPGYDVAVSLALMIVAKDAERIGDYCKNVFEVGALYTEGFNVPKYQEPLDRVSEETVEMFRMVSDACRKSDEGKAEGALVKARDIRKQCDRVIQEMFADEDQIEFHEAVAYSLLARHYKRVAAHLANIATAVLGHVEDLDFYHED